jgi:hypothetical protein
MHIRCYCDDCQAYAGAIERPDILDAHGGTEIWQTAPARVKIEQGREHVRCLRLSDKGMMRWHTSCCRSPIGNTMTSARVPFVGLMRTFIARDDVTDLLGPPLMTQARFAKGGMPDGAHKSATLGIVAGALRVLGGNFLTGAHKPHPFFDEGGKPVVAPRVLTPAERAALR